MGPGLIIAVLEMYFDWRRPGYVSKTGWTKVRCPNPDHEDSEPSASLNSKEGKVRCFACGFRADVYDLIMREEECSFRDAKQIAEGLAQEGNVPVPPGPRRKSGRRTFGSSEPEPGEDFEVPTRRSFGTGTWT